MDTMSANYCRSKGEQIALNVDGTSQDDSSTYSMFVTFPPSLSLEVPCRSPRLASQLDMFLFSVPKAK